MGYSFSNDTPIYLQIIEHIKTKIISREYCPNDRLPSVRELSLQYEVNPNTVLRALAELEGMGLIYTERTNGKFVTGDTDIISKVKMQTISEMIDNFYGSMESLGLTRAEIQKILNYEVKK